MAKDAPRQCDYDKWTVYRHTLTFGHPVLESEKSTLLMSLREDGACEAEFCLASSEDKRNRSIITLRRHLIGVDSYVGRSGRYRVRLICVNEPQLGLQALMGHISMVDRDRGELGEHGIRDFFIATREPRDRRVPRDTPPFLDKTWDFEARLKMPLEDQQPHSRAGVLRLSKNELVLEPFSYSIAPQALDCGALEFREVLQQGSHSIGGLVLPLDSAASHLLMVCFRHLHAAHRHGPEEDDEAGTVGDVPGHPICTNVYGGFAAY
ncbi:MAG TPA: hypothetical protein VKY89_00325 [Thermoanaerobaculia bacterium]|jgi:hypothetical protein|nr:hypothetical protein [Thermoanaerobaculia bacterium]